MSGLANLADGGRALVPLVQAVDLDVAAAAPLIVAIVPNGVPVAEPLADSLSLPVAAARIEREGEPRLTDMPDCAGRTVIVVDDGVETGTAAGLVGAAARAGGAARVILAVPVCPREAQALLAATYDDVLAVERPLVRRDLRWHYAEFDTIDEAEALRRLARR